MPASAEASRQPAADVTTSRPSRRRMTATDLALVATFAGLIVVLGTAGTWYPVGAFVPVTIQTLGVMLAGAVLGWRRGVAAALLVVAMCAIGLPVLAGGRGGLGVFAGPTVGYLVGWVPGAGVIGWLVQLRLPRSPLWWNIVACLVGGVVVIYLFGILAVSLRTGVSLGTAVGAAAVFLPGDLVKAVAAAVVARAVHRASPGLTAPLHRHQR